MFPKFECSILVSPVHIGDLKNITLSTVQIELQWDPNTKLALYSNGRLVQFSNSIKIRLKVQFLGLLSAKYLKIRLSVQFVKCKDTRPEQHTKAFSGCCILMHTYA